jgi:hypothetical protein
VISPDGHLAWYPLTETGDVQAIVTGEYAPGALDGAFVTGPLPRHRLRCRAARPAALPAEPARAAGDHGAFRGRIGQPWRGYIALAQYEQDGSTGEWLWPGEMSAEWAERITAAVSGSTERRQR